MPDQPEAFSRILIDKALEASGWNLLDSLQVQFEVHGSSGRADYVLKGPKGPLCVLEAKRENLDPYVAKEKAREYAETLHAPFIILSNGNEHWFWNYERADQRDAYRIERLPSPEDLERVRLKNLQPPRPLLDEEIEPDYLKPFKDEVTVRYVFRAIQLEQPAPQAGTGSIRVRVGDLCFEDPADTCSPGVGNSVKCE